MQILHDINLDSIMNEAESMNQFHLKIDMISFLNS